MTTLTVAAAELARIVRAVEKSAAKDDARPVLAGIHARVEGDRLTLAAADGFRLSTAYATLDESAETDATATLERAGLLAFTKSLKPKDHPLATIDIAADGWTFAANGTRAAVRLIDGTYPDFQSIVGTGDEPVLFAIDAKYLADVLSAHATGRDNGERLVRIGRAKDDPSAPLFLTHDDGSRSVIMPMVVTSPSADWKRAEDAAPAPACAHGTAYGQSCDGCAADHAARMASIPAPVAVAVANATDEPENASNDADVSASRVANASPTPVTPAESAYRTRDAANERRTAKRAERRAAATAGTIAHDAPVCATCDTPAAPSDNFCAECGNAFGEPAPVAVTRAPVTTPYALTAYSEKNQQRILAQCPHASDVRGFHAWLKAGRVVMKGQKGIRIIAPVMGGDGNAKVVNIKPAYVFDVTQTDERTARAAA